MVEVAPFRAHEYDAAKVHLADVVSPPYDIITAETRETLRRRSPHNIVHVTLPQATGAEDAYEESHRLLDQWIEDGILRPTKEEVMYAYECAYEHAGDTRRMRGVVARLRLDPTYTAVLPHEQIFEEHAESRVHLLRATGVDIEPIQFFYAGKGPEQALWAYIDGSGRKPDMSAPGLDGATHKYWRITDPAIIGTVVQGFKGKKAYIADGHHRYAAALVYAKERREREYRPPKNSPWEYKFALFVHGEDPGLLILPTHRVLYKAPVKKPKEFLERWARRFDVEAIPVDASHPMRALGEALQANEHPHVLGAWLGEKGKAYLLKAKDPAAPGDVVAEGSRTFRGLDVVFLQHVAIGDALGIPKEEWSQAVTYTRDDEDAERLMRSKKAVAVLTHRPTRMSQLRAIADGGEKMPQKSTYFIPKTLSGFAFYRIGRPEGPPSKRRITS